ncbi:crosveinless 2-secreting protein [Musca autumnalis]|uniref:crosveinless 2-secreting protein n=1 Tax=Musca autumnalis TaxID=221902 RepID=UPI003CEA70E4
MFTLENYTNLKRRRNKVHAEQGEFPCVENPLTLPALEKEETCNATSSCSVTTSIATTATTTPSIAPQNEKEIHRQQCNGSGHQQHKSHLIASKSKKSINKNFLPSTQRTFNDDDYGDLQCRRKNSKSITATTAGAASSSSSFSTWTSLCLSSILSSAWTLSTSTAAATTSTEFSVSSQPATALRALKFATVKAKAATIVARFVRDLCKIATSNTTITTNNSSVNGTTRRRHMLLTLMLLLFVCFVNTSSVKAADSLLGNLQSCSDENEEIHVPISKCYTCSCQNGFVKCEDKCPPIDDCYLLEKKTSDNCCQKCKGCMFLGKPYPSGAEWTDPMNPCKSYKCVGTVVTATEMKCYTQCDDSQLIKPRPGECCPSCQGCKINGQIVLEGQEVVGSIDDRCLVCQCKDNQLTCAKKTCPVLQCPVSKQKLLPNECCPKCIERRDFMPLTGKCFLANKVLHDKIQFMPDRCTNCTCSNGTSICERKTCPILECSPEYQEMDGCCPRCITSEVRSECILNGKTYQNNETWNVDTCRSCRCTGGNIRCSEMRCPAVKCRSNEELKVLPGECCPKCIETAGTCTVFGDPHFKTFDGKFFSFQGSCKYLLASDCHDKTFSIRLTNDGRQTKRSSWAKTVTLKMKGIRVNLGQKQRVKVNGTRVALPYASGPITSIEKLSESIMLKTDLGLTIEWDGNNYLQVTVPSSFKNRMCGLCGNYNGWTRDDLTSRDGVNHTEAWRFANSWKVGGPKACSRKQENIAVEPTCRQRKSNALCRPLRESEVFGDCDSTVNPENYHDACKMDVCDCPTGMCHCDSFAAYARECQRLGVRLPNWRAATSCPQGQWKRDFNSTLKILRNNPYYGDLRFLQNQQKTSRRRKLEEQQHHHNQLLQQDFINKHVPKNLLISKSPDRTPPPLH